MILPIVTLGNKILRKKCEPVTKHDEQLSRFINDMWETLHNSNGVGLAAPQANSNLQLFIVNSTLAYNELDAVDQSKLFPDDTGINETFINARIIEKSKDTWRDEEGCLSIPGIYEQVNRAWQITVEYRNLNFEQQVRTFSGYTARVIQHEYDHTQGKLFIDHISPLRKKILRSRLMKIINGKVKTSYAMLVTNK